MFVRCKEIDIHILNAAGYTSRPQCNLLQENPMYKFVLSVSLTTVLLAGTAFAGDDPILARQQLMEETRDAAKVIGGMLRGQAPFNAEDAMSAFEVWKNTAAKAGDLFPEGSDTGHDTEATQLVWTDRDGFNQAMGKFATRVDAAIAAKPESLEALKGAAGPVFQACKGCHEGYRLEKED